MMKSMKKRLLGLPLLALIGFMGHALAASPPVVQRINMTVEPDKVDCVGVAPMKCLVVNGKLFYDEIAGFHHVRGFQYQLSVERTTNSSVPAGSSQYSYRLVKVLAKYLAPPPPAPASNIQYVNMTVAPHKVDCVGVVPMKCMVVNGSYFYGQITNFRHIEGFKYQLRVQRTQNSNIPADGNRFSYRLAKILTKQWMP